MNTLIIILKGLGILIFAPLVGGVLTGIDRKITAKMQGRKGPPILQPFYDVMKLMQKESTTVNYTTRYFVTLSLFFGTFTVILSYLGLDLLLCIFSYTLACVFFVLAGYSAYSPFSFVGSEREMIQIMCYEPMLMILAFGFYLVSGSFFGSAVFTLNEPAIIQLPFIFLGLLYVLNIKLRKSPFDLSMSHHGHQEIVKGITTEMTGVCMAMVEVCHWVETMFALGLVYLFFAYRNPVSWILGIVACLLAFFLTIVVDNAFARIRWKFALLISWITIVVTGGANLLLLSFRTR